MESSPVRHCFSLIQTFTFSNCLKLSSYQYPRLKITVCTARHINHDALINPNEHTHNLGVHFDCNLYFNKHISGLPKNCFLLLNDIRILKQYYYPRICRIKTGHQNNILYNYLPHRCHIILASIIQREKFKIFPRYFIGIQIRRSSCSCR